MRWRALFIGLGSAGLRHLQALREVADAEALYWPSGKGAGLKTPMREGVRACSSLAEAIAQKPNFAVVANPTALHAATALDLARANVPFLLEKPVSDRVEGLAELMALVRGKNLPVAVGFQMRHHPGFKKLRELISAGGIGRPLCLQGQVGQHLPDWHPDSDYRKGYSARPELGGGVILDLCHEIDIAMALMGRPESVSCMAGHASALEIDTEDVAEITLDHGRARYSHIHLDYLERGYQWTTRVIGSEGSVLWDAGRGFVEFSAPAGRIERWNDPEGFNRDSLFRDQLRSWLAVLEGRAAPEVGLAQGLLVTRIAWMARLSADSARHLALEEASG